MRDWLWNQVSARLLLCVCVFQMMTQRGLLNVTSCKQHSFATVPPHVAEADYDRDRDPSCPSHAVW
jgi:hypothetical protein